MDFSNPLGIQYRVVEEIGYKGQPARVVSGSASYETAIDDLWDAITNSERIPRWFLPVSGELQLGGRYKLEGHASGEITRCDPPEALNISWECGDSVSWLHLRLDAVENGCRLTLDHIMLKDEASEEHWQKYGPGATGVGWDLSFWGLFMHIRTGESVPQDKSHAWMASEAGKAFIRKCSKAWGSAHIDAGEDEAIAQEMAKATGNFYCGE